MATKQIKPGKITDTQNYLLSRLPHAWDVSRTDEKEPSHISRIKIQLKRFEQKQVEAKVAHKQKIQKELNFLREAIYFESPEEALKKIKAFEAKYDISN